MPGPSPLGPCTPARAAAGEVEGVLLSLGYVRTPIHLRKRIQDRSYFFGKGLPRSLHPCSESRYKAGDCPVAEHRRGETERQIRWSSSLRGEQAELVDQYLQAFQTFPRTWGSTKGLPGATGWGGRVMTSTIEEWHRSPGAHPAMRVIVCTFNAARIGWQTVGDSSRPPGG